MLMESHANECSVRGRNLHMQKMTDESENENTRTEACFPFPGFYPLLKRAEGDG